MLGPVGRRGGERHLGRSRRRRSTPEEAAAGGPGSLAARELSARGGPCRRSPHDEARAWRRPMARSGARWPASRRRPSRRRAIGSADGGRRRSALPAAGAVALHPLRRPADGRGGLVQLLQLERLRRADATSSGWRNFELLFANARLPHRAHQQPADHRGLAARAAAAGARRWRCCWPTGSAAPSTFRMIFFLPYILADVAAGLIWRFVYDGDYGLLAKIWAGVRRRRRPSCSPSRDLAMYAILVVDRVEVFRLPHDALHRRPAADRPQPLRGGATSTAPPAGRCFCRVTLPLLGPTIRLSVFFVDPRLAPALRPDHAADQGRPARTARTRWSPSSTASASRACGSASAARSASSCSSSASSFAFGYKRILMRND